MKAEVVADNKDDHELERFTVIVNKPGGGFYITCTSNFAAQLIADAFVGVTDIGRIKSIR